MKQYVYTRRMAISDVRMEANALIEQLERLDKGWDKGIYRDDDTWRDYTIAQKIRSHVETAFRISWEFS